MSVMVGPQRRCIQTINNNNNKNSTPIQTNNMSIDMNLNKASNSKQVLNEDNSLEIGYYLHRNKLGEGMDQWSLHIRYLSI